MVDDVGRRSLDELRLLVDRLRAAAGLLARGGWKDVSSLCSSAARVALDARRRTERLLAEFSRPRDQQLLLIDLPDSIASRLESAWRRARADLEERWGAGAVSSRLGQLWEGPVRDTLRGVGRWAGLAVRPLRREETSETARRSSVAEQDARRRVLEGTTVLVVDDAADDREAMQALFETLGARVISAGNGQEAMDRLREAGADVVFCDLRMPQVDGFEFIRRLRADPKCQGLPAIAVSGVGSGGSRLRARELGYDAFLSKPPEFDALGLFVRRAMESRRSSSH
ncbi:MAG TPA: response regulator [Verrucomicrobiae bacterium]|nr:response regulator [Verrucomicrobiae bacterium]